MKKIVAFLLALIIFVAPITTLVKADVVIGDNDDVIVNENATILGRKIALMESLSDLALSGVTEFTISNTNDVDSYFDSFWNELNDAIESLSDGTGFQEISNDLKSRYFTNLVQYKDYINNRGDYFANLLQNPSTSLLSTFFANNVFGKHSTLHNNLSLQTFRSLSAYRGSGNNPTPDTDFSFINNINNIICDRNNHHSNYFDVNSYKDLWGGSIVDNANYQKRAYTYVSNSFSHVNVDNTRQDTQFSIFSPLISIYCTTNQDNSISVLYSSSSSITYNNLFSMISAPNQQSTLNNSRSINFYFKNDSDTIPTLSSASTNYPTTYYQNSFASLTLCINYIYQHYANINLYVDGVPWALVGDSTSSPILDIDGFLKIYGNDNPVQYELQPNTQIDYDQLYQVIYNAIRDNLPISQGDINYYDSHDTIYSPTIINNYGEEEGDESDLIDTILDYAVIPKFDTAIAQPMRAALTNGVVIMNNSITNVIPDEILLILGACFFLLLFAVVINRMIK